MKIVEKIKEANQDFEFYPTTREIIRVINADLQPGRFSIMDVGAGNGSFFNILEDLNPIELNEYGHEINSLTFNKYAIEKSQILINSMASDIFVIGTDFHQQSFIDKKMDIIFCNPPYSEYKEWMIKLIKEANCSYLYLVIPERWKTTEVEEVIKQRKAEYKILGNFSFIDSEFRKARAKVDIVKISYSRSIRGYNTNKSDPFDLWFKEHFNIEAEETSKTEYQQNNERKEKIKTLVDKSKLIHNLVCFYEEELQKLISNYKSVENLDSQLLKELNVSIEGLKGGLKSKISGLKNIYWRELFENLEAITKKLTSKSRQSLLDTLAAHTSVDFTSENIYSVVIWAIKNSNKYIDSQLSDLYKEITEPKNIIKYKSNKRMIDDNWRYNRREMFEQGKYLLDYRIIYSYAGSCMTSNRNGQFLTQTGSNLIRDIFAIAANLGYNVLDDTVYSYETPGFEYGKNKKFYCNDGELFMTIKFYMNGNAHIKLNQKFMKAFNIEAARLNGWIKSPEEAAEEMGLKINEVLKYFKSNIKIENKNIKLLA